MKELSLLADVSLGALVIGIGIGALCFLFALIKDIFDDFKHY